MALWLRTVHFDGTVAVACSVARRGFEGETRRLLNQALGCSGAIRPGIHIGTARRRHSGELENRRVGRHLLLRFLLRFPRGNWPFFRT